jgi:hypothetical protein
MKRTVLLVLPIALAGALLIACGSGSGGGNKVTVELNEWSVKPASTTMQNGQITFEAKNTGTRLHELRVSRLGGTSPQLVDVITSFPAGQTQSKQFTLTPGRYELSCQLAEQEAGQIINHYALGMKTEITVE